MYMLRNTEKKWILYSKPFLNYGGIVGCVRSESGYVFYVTFRKATILNDHLTITFPQHKKS